MDKACPLSIKILVVEDEATQRRLLVRMLERGGYEVIEAADGRQGLECFLRESDLRLVITDLLMPEMDGFELIGEIRRQEMRYTYVIVLSALEEREAVLKALEAGADDYLPKPIHGDELALRLAGARRLLQIESQDELILAMVKLAGSRSDETGAHLDRVSEYSRILALDIAGQRPDLLNNQLAEEIAKVTPLHDIGKVGIPDSILHKPGRLTAEEFELMKTHTTVGGGIIKEIYERNGSTYLRMAYEVAMYHHERWDGTGYPEGLAGDDIPLIAQIMALADVFDALTAKRCYKEAFSYERAKAIILEGKGSHFSPLVVESYLRCEQDWLAVLERYKETLG